MSGLAMLWHQLRYDARRARTLVLATWALMALSAWNAWPTTLQPIWPAVVGNAYAAALVLVSVLVVLAAAPARPDAFHGGKPVPPTVRLGSTLLLAFGVATALSYRHALSRLLAITLPLALLIPATWIIARHGLAGDAGGIAWLRDGLQRIGLPTQPSLRHLLKNLFWFSWPASNSLRWGTHSPSS